MHSKRTPPSIEDIKKYLIYKKSEGKLYWKYKKYSKDKLGKEVGFLNARNYRRFTFLTKTYYAHQIIFFLEKKIWPTCLDHIDGNPLNNKISNLRDGTQADNNRNTAATRSGKKLIGTTYVSIKQYDRKKRWVAQTKINGKNIYLGHYFTQQEAHQAYLDFYKNNKQLGEK